MIGEAERLRAMLVAHRRDIHKHAEVKWTEFRTTSVVADALESLGFSVFLGPETTTCAGAFVRPGEEEVKHHVARAKAQGASAEVLARTSGIPGVIGELDLGRSGPVLAFRFDMDALAGDEAEEHRPAREGFASVNPGCVHACGHDGHTAIGIGLASRIAAHASELAGKVRLIFQPSEEGGGGAAGIVDKGWLDDADALFAVHLALARNGRPLRSGELGAGCVDFLDSRRFDVHYKGRAAHPCGDPQNGRNALFAACGACRDIFAIPPHGEGLFRANVGILTAGTSRNTVATDASFAFEVRGENRHIADYGQERALRILRGHAAAHEIDCAITDAGHTPSGRSDEKAIARVKAAAAHVPWFERIHTCAEVGGSDDATEMMNRVQSRGGIATYMGIGTDITGGLHASGFDFDEDALPATVELLLAVTRGFAGS